MLIQTMEMERRVVSVTNVLLREVQNTTVESSQHFRKVNNTTHSKTHPTNNACHKYLTILMYETFTKGQ